jgi:hypothetical protein
MTINVLASEQSNDTEITAEKVIKASDMILHIHSDAYYISENEAKSRAWGFFYMGNNNKHDKNSQTAQF